MATIHFLNVGEGDCILVQHISGRVSMIDISCGNLSAIEEQTNRFMKSAGLVTPGGTGNYNMKAYPTRPQDYLAGIGITTVWRFILTHPDMDHLDGFNALMGEFAVKNFWHSGAHKPKPNFGNFKRYKEEDWDRYVKVRDGKEAGTRTLQVLAGQSFKYANEDDNGGGGDGLQVIAPSRQLVKDANQNGDFNDCSYVIIYRTGGFKIVFTGDSHDATWDHILENHAQDVADCDLLMAPHHGRDSGRSWDFLDLLKPRLTLFGVARSEHLAYAAWNQRNLDKITNNQAGNVVLDVVGNQLHVYVENDAYAESINPSDSTRNSQGYRTLGYLLAKP